MRIIPTQASFALYLFYWLIANKVTRRLFLILWAK